MVVLKPRDNISFYQDGYLNKLLLELKKAVSTKPNSVFIIIDGRSGMGKSTLATQIGCTLNPNCDINDVYYVPKELSKALSKAKQEDVFIFDEAMLLSSRNSLTEVNKMMIQVMSMIRSKRVYIIFCINSIFDLDRNLALHRADLLLHCYGDLLNKGRFCAFFKPAGNSPSKITQLYILGKKYYSYSKPTANFHGRFIDIFAIDETEYEKRKQKAINEFLTGSIKKKNIRDNILHKSISYMKDKTHLTPKQISEICSCSHKTIYTILGEEDLRDL